MSFYVELPEFDGGSTSMPRAVVEGVIVQGGPEHHPWTNPGRQALVFSAPPELAGKCCYVDSHAGWAEVPGPARMLTRDEYNALIATLKGGTSA